jgi:hypothetical protein
MWAELDDILKMSLGSSIVPPSKYEAIWWDFFATMICGIIVCTMAIQIKQEVYDGQDSSDFSKN